LRVFGAARLFLVRCFESLRLLVDEVMAAADTAAIFLFMLHAGLVLLVLDLIA
jgi:hypothetical protein